MILLVGRVFASGLGVRRSIPVLKNGACYLLA